MLYAAIDSHKHAFRAAVPLEEGFWRLGWKPVPHWRFAPQPNAAYAAATSGPSLPMSGETLTIEDSMTLRARMENAGHVGDEQEWSWSSG